MTMTHAYERYYLDDAKKNLGCMMDYAVNDCHYDPDDFFSWFISSGISKSFEQANPKYICGMSGVELAWEIIYSVTGERIDIMPTYPLMRSPEYWAGWIMAYYQWDRCVRFVEMKDYGLLPSKVLSMYILHEAPEEKFCDVADDYIKRVKEQSPSKLSVIRKSRGLSQRELAESSGVALRMIQLYEQKQNDISKAQVRTLAYLSAVLGCSIEDLID